MQQTGHIVEEAFYKTDSLIVVRSEHRKIICKKKLTLLNQSFTV